MPDKGGRIHVNQLSRWKERPCQVNSVIEDGEEIEEYQWTNRRQDVQFGAQLPEDKKKEIHQLLSKYRRVTKDTPGHIDRTTHKIRTTDSTPIRQKSYRIPQAYKGKVYEESEHMEKNGIIEKSKSEWASPLVIVVEAYAFA